MMFYEMISNQMSIEDYLQEESDSTAICREDTNSNSCRSNIVEEHKLFSGKLYCDLLKSDISEPETEEELFRECNEIKSARILASSARDNVHSAYQYFQQRKLFWDLFK